MKHTLIALGAALACLGTAHAQSNVELSGLVDMYVGSMKAPGGARTSQVGSGGLTTSWWGIKGTEDLGNGLKAGFALGAFFRADTGTPGRWDVGSGAYDETFFARDANVSLSGGFGTVKLGRSMAPNFLPTILFNPYGDSFTVSPLVLHANTGWGVDDTHNYKTTAADTGWSNQITYSTPSFGGLSANLHYQFGEQSGDNKNKKNVGANVLYFQGPLALTAFIERAQIRNPNTSEQPTKQNWMLGGSYDFSVAKLYATYGQSKVKDSTVPKYDAKTTSLGVDVPVTKAGTFKAAAAYTKAETANPADIKRTTYTLLPVQAHRCVHRGDVRQDQEHAFSIHSKQRFRHQRSRGYPPPLLSYICWQEKTAAACAQRFFSWMVFSSRISQPGGIARGCAVSARHTASAAPAVPAPVPDAADSRAAPETVSAHHGAAPAQSASHRSHK